MGFELNRRTLLGGAAAAAGLLQGRLGWAAEQTQRPSRLLKTLKIGMVDVDGGLAAKFAAVKSAGFEGIELDAPGIDVEEARAAIEETGLPVDGTVCGSHWNVRHTDPDPQVRARALADLQEAIRQTKAIGGHTVLLVPGHGKDGDNQQQLIERSFANIVQALPLAAELGVVIAMENVWNHFLYQHDGPVDQPVDAWRDYIDLFDSPWVGMQFDIGNHWKYAQVGEWIRALGKRIVKLDIKGFSRAEDRFTKIGEGDLPWDDVRAALAEIHYTGWVAAEVQGGDVERLREVAANIDRVLRIED